MGDWMKEILDRIDDEIKEKLMKCWKNMNETEKMHFINQVALSLSVWGDDLEGRKMVIDVLSFLARNGSTTLADFGIYVDDLLKEKIPENKKAKVKRASLILEGYRIKNNLPSLPHRDITI